MHIPVSVVIPYYNAETHFRAALESVENQTVNPAQIIVVDDGSGAAGRQQLSAFAGRFELVTLPRNGGPAVARNAGVAAASQPYVAFLDTDDAWAPDKLAVQYEFMAAWPEVDATHTNVVFFFHDGQEVTKKKTNHMLTVESALARHTMITPTIMVRRASFDALGGFDPGFRCAQDWELQIRMALAGCQVQYIDRVLTRVRREGHGNHSWNWACYLAGHIRILLKHRRTYVARFGYRDWVRRFGWECYRASVRTRGWKQKLLRLPAAFGP